MIKRLEVLVLAVTLCLVQPVVGQKSSHQKGDLLKSELVGSFDKNKLSSIVDSELASFLAGSPMPFSEFQGKFPNPKYEVQLYRLTYQTSIPEKNKMVLATGLVAIPSGAGSLLPMVSYQHGTVFGRQVVPSYTDNSMETKLVVSQFGSQGYVVIGADYIGLGDSDEPNSYIVQKSTEEACIDFYAAANTFLKQKQVTVSKFFTIGWSQGAYNNLTFLRRLEQQGVSVAASMSASTPADLYAFVAGTLSNRRPIDAAYAAGCFTNLLFAYEYYYGIKDLTKSIIKPQYYDLAKAFFEFKISFEEFLKRTSPVVQDIIQPEFIVSMQKGNHPLRTVLEDAEAYRWKSITPLRLYYGKADEVIPVYLGTLAVFYQENLGKLNGTVHSAGERADHRATYVYSLLDSKKWFDSYLN